MSTSPPQFLEQAKTTYEDKEQDYGESWRLTGKILQLIIDQQGKDEITIPNEYEYFAALGLYTRRLDKLVRSFNGTFIADEMVVDENTTETISDQIAYAAMHSTLSLEMETEETQPSVAATSSEEPSEYCPNCGKQSTDYADLKSREGHKWEFYCPCGHVWLDSTSA